MRGHLLCNVFRAESVRRQSSPAHGGQLGEARGGVCREARETRGPGCLAHRQLQVPLAQVFAVPGAHRLARLFRREKRQPRLSRGPSVGVLSNVQRVGIVLVPAEEREDLLAGGFERQAADLDGAAV